MGCIVALGIIDTFAVMLRFLSRKKTVIGINADDWLILASLIPAYAMIVAAGFCWLPLSVSAE